MRVIKENQIERKHKCDGCKSIYAYLTTDVDHNIYPSTRCPVCNKLNRVSIFDKKV